MTSVSFIVDCPTQLNESLQTCINSLADCAILPDNLVQIRAKTLGVSTQKDVLELLLLL